MFDAETIFPLQTYVEYCSNLEAYEAIVEELSNMLGKSYEAVRILTYAAYLRHFQAREALGAEVLSLTGKPRSTLCTEVLSIAAKTTYNSMEVLENMKRNIVYRR